MSDLTQEEYDITLRKGEEIYRTLCEALEPEHNGKFVVIDTRDRNFRVDSSGLYRNATDAIKMFKPPFYPRRIGASFSEWCDEVFQEAIIRSEERKRLNR